MERKYNFRSWLVGNLRKISYKYPPRYTATNRAKTGPNEYKCNQCGKLFPRKEINIDHINPIVPISGFPLLENGEEDWTTYIKSMFCDEDGFQILCEEHHAAKTKLENSARKLYRESKKKLDKEEKEE